MLGVHRYGRDAPFYGHHHIIAPFHGKHHTEDWKEKHSQRMKGRHVSPETEFKDGHEFYK